jgi:GTP-binding protein
MVLQKIIIHDPMKVALVGRPNVGKSSLFNRMLGSKRAIVHEIPGVTRDCLIGQVESFGQMFQLIDTGGISLDNQAILQKQIYAQTLQAIKESYSLIIVVDGKEGLHPVDREIAMLVLKEKKTVIVAVNKMDNPSQLSKFHEFYALGIEQMFATSAIQGHGLADILEALNKQIVCDQPVKQVETIKVAIVGKTNVGKSTLLNTLLGYTRSIVSDLAGTTRDAIDSVVEHCSRQYMLIDTAGIRRKKSERDVIEKFSRMRTEKAIQRADICLMIIDVQDGLAAEDKKIIGYIEKQKKGCILLFNKWDTMKGMRMEHVFSCVKHHASFLKHCPMQCISASQKKNIGQIFTNIDTVYRALHTRIATAELNRFVASCLKKVAPTMIQGKRLKIYYMTQISVAPPEFVFFVNSPRYFCPSYRRYLLNQFLATYSFPGIALSFKIKAKNQ